MKKFRKFQALILIVAMLLPVVCNGITANSTTENQIEVKPEKCDTAVVKAVEKESDNPRKACEMINNIEDITTYEESLRTVLDEYYLESDEKSIKLIDGDLLADFMVKYGIGVDSVKIFNIYKIDSDYFQ